MLRVQQKQIAIIIDCIGENEKQQCLKIIMTEDFRNYLVNVYRV